LKWSELIAAAVFGMLLAFIGFIFYCGWMGFHWF